MEDINPRDFRAWYGLGQAYEVLKMPYYSLYYSQRAAAIKWVAGGQIVGNLDS